MMKRKECITYSTTSFVAGELDIDDVDDKVKTSSETAMYD